MLTTLQHHGVFDAVRMAGLEHCAPPPWWLAVLQGIAAWIASLLIISSFFAPLMLLGEGPLVRGVGGVVLVGGAVWLFARDSLFTGQMGLAFSLAGQALLVSVVFDGFDAFATRPRVIAAVGLAIAVGMLVPASTVLHRTVCALLALGYGAVLVGPGDALAIYALVLTAAAAACWLLRRAWAASPRAALIKALAHALTLAALVAGWIVAVDPSFGALLSPGTSTATLPTAAFVYPLGAGIVLLATIAWLVRGLPPAQAAAGIGAGAIYALTAWNAPGLAVSGALLLAVFHACHRPWIALTLLAAIVYLGRFYYSLEATLLVKSGALAATGLVLLGLQFGLRRWRRTRP